MPRLSQYPRGAAFPVAWTQQLTVADELLLDSLDDETKAAIARLVRARLEEIYEHIEDFFTYP